MTAAEAATRGVEACRAKLVVLFLLRGVGEDFIGGLDLLEFFARIRFFTAVWVVFFGSRIVCFLDFGGGGGFGDPEGLVRVFLGRVGGGSVEVLEGELERS